MKTPLPTYVITTLAMYQTEFWAQVAEELRSAGAASVFLSFDDRSTEYLRDRGVQVYGAAPKRHMATDEALSTLAAAGIVDINYWLAHERITFGIRDTATLVRKLAGYLEWAGAVCREVQRQKSLVMVQEVGGFACVIASFFAARRLGIDNWFIEPSFFRGRLFFTRNTFGAPCAEGNCAGSSDPEMLDYLAGAVRDRRIVVPGKDRHHYNAAIKKVVNVRNARRLVEKAVDKYLLGKHQEFGYIGRHVATHLKMLQNSWRLRDHYSSVEEAGPFVYYPFHVPADMALTLRAPQFLDQLALVDYLARTVPHTHKVVVKEHPAMIGGIDAVRLIGLLTRYDNLVVLPPSTNNYDVIQRAAAVVSVNSKSGAEALLIGRPVIALGDAFYSGSPLVRRVESLKGLGPALMDVLTEPSRPTRAMVEAFFQQVWNMSHPGELFVANRENSSRFARSLLEATTPFAAHARAGASAAAPTVVP